MPAIPDIAHRAARAAGGGQVIAIEGLVEHQNAARSRPADKFVRREGHRIDRGIGVICGVHIDGRVGGRRRAIERQNGVMRVQQLCQAAHICDDAGNVGGRRERANARPAPPLRRFKQGFQRRIVYPAIGAELYPHHFGHAFAPAQLVGMVLVRPDKHDRTRGRQMGFQSRFGFWPQSGADRIAHAGKAGGRAGNAQNFLQLVDGGGRACAAGDEGVVFRGVHRAPDGGLGLFQPGIGGTAGGAVFGMRIGEECMERIDLVFHRAVRAAGGGIVCIDKRALPERRADHAMPGGQPFAQRVHCLSA